MPERDFEPFSNPIAPSEGKSRDDAQQHRLTNEDFRKLLMTPRTPSTSSTSSSRPETLSSVRSERDDDRGERRRKKKKFYATLKKQEEDKLAELAKRYRDRAKERREGANPDYQNDDPLSSTAGYRAVAPDAKSGLDAAERRRQMIQESKFLGGDMEHTHLVKGLDYALLQKVRSEIHYKEQEMEEEEVEPEVKDKEKVVPVEEEILFKTKLGRNIYRLFHKNEATEKNDLFLPGRMAYIIDLEDDYAESDIPTTLVRSKAECPSFESQTTLTTNDIVINKLTQILSYLRQGLHSKKGKKKEKGRTREDEKETLPPAKIDESIYGDIGDYVPSLEKREREHRSDKSRRHHDDRDRDRKHHYFEKPSAEDEQYSKHDYRDRDYRLAWGKDVKSEPSDSKESKHSRKEDKRLEAKLSHKLERDQPESYAECYPGAPETEDAVIDSDDDVDYSKMDMGNKKGPIGRWDFDTQEEYSDYMSNKEAMPKAAFQYGVKMADGRKTRRGGPKKPDEKTKLDRELQKINQILHKRKQSDSAGVGMDEPDYKRAKY